MGVGKRIPRLWGLAFLKPVVGHIQPGDRDFRSLHKYKSNVKGKLLADEASTEAGKIHELSVVVV
jgi:hypothetical protein